MPSRTNYISIAFKIDGSQTGGFKTVDGMAKISRAGIVVEFEAKIFGIMKTGIKEVRIPLAEIEEVRVGRKFFKHTLEIWLNNFRTLSEIPNKDGRIILQISKEDRTRAEQAARVLQTARSETDALEILNSPVSRLFGDDEETKETENE
ncbi:MAG: hypothetical protein AVDCRST_MAG74-1349 [uncultured Pyrinomonadaceae bacterium]|uniref:Uncharacterized protein n=1 Tax=uncultured Pyrinomonadaceae bacterium TaxID=2283094 RepID=A0A6J4NV98_9BACT|nr:MAG: hypothetical protein AVDCRST_MAG74-1349 [uncultured Pyrinomonadaceae bacterium]